MSSIICFQSRINPVVGDMVSWNFINLKSRLIADLPIQIAENIAYAIFYEGKQSTDRVMLSVIRERASILTWLVFVQRLSADEVRCRKMLTCLVVKCSRACDYHGEFVPQRKWEIISLRNWTWGFCGFSLLVRSVVPPAIQLGMQSTGWLSLWTSLGCPFPPADHEAVSPALCPLWEPPVPSLAVPREAALLRLLCCSPAKVRECGGAFKYNEVLWWCYLSPSLPSCSGGLPSQSETQAGE